MLLLRRRPPSTLLPGDWVWPLAMWKGKPPAITEPFGSQRSGPGGIRHRGIDLAYADGAMPEGQAALAAADGVVWSALPTPFGLAIVIDHAPLPFTTYYAHLEKLLVEHAFRGDAKQRVRAGQAIGIVGHDLLNPAKRRHLHFELWRDTPANAIASPGYAGARSTPEGSAESIDPAPFMRRWDVMPDPREQGGKLVFRHLGDPGTPYPPWLRELEGQKSGIYVIREVDDGDVLYVGSSIGQLHGAVLRHFDRWRRFWSATPVPRFARDRCEVAVRVTRAADAPAEALRAVQRLHPRAFQLVPSIVRHTAKESA